MSAGAKVISDFPILQSSGAPALQPFWPVELSGGGPLNTGLLMQAFRILITAYRIPGLRADGIRRF